MHTLKKLYVTKLVYSVQSYNPIITKIIMLNREMGAVAIRSMCKGVLMCVDGRVASSRWSCTIKS
jgi:hypothetical protein